MKEVRGELWHYIGHAAIVITTGGLVTTRSECAMPRGCARQARDRFPGLALKLGLLIEEKGNHVHDLGNGLVSFPVENSPYEVPDLRLIERSCRELVELTDNRNWSMVVVPRPGCGAGGLSWKDVKPILERYLDDRFLVIDRIAPN